MVTERAVIGRMLTESYWLTALRAFARAVSRRSYQADALLGLLDGLDPLMGYSWGGVEALIRRSADAAEARHNREHGESDVPRPHFMRTVGTSWLGWGNESGTVISLELQQDVTGQTWTLTVSADDAQEVQRRLNAALREGE